MDPSPPALVPELYVSDLDRSIDAYVGVFGFTLLFQRPEERFAYLEREGAHLMIEEANGPGRKLGLAPPQGSFGLGLNLQIRVSDVGQLHDAVIRAGLTPLVAPEERWYRQQTRERGQRQFVVADPDGYLLRFYTDLGVR